MANLGTLWFGSDIDLTNLKQKIQQGNQEVLDALKLSYDPRSYSDMVSKLRTALGSEVFEIKVNANAQKAKETINQTLNAMSSGGQINPVNPAAIGNVNQLKLAVIEAGESVRRTNSYIKELERELQMVRRTSGEFSPEAMKIREELARARMSLREEKDLQGQSTYQKRLASLTQSQLNQQMREGASAARQLASDSIRVNTTLANGIHISTRLGSALSSLFAVDAARRFLENVIEIGGQLEMQRISIGAILDDVSHANELFGQIKDLAIKSPFGVVELDQYSKQLSAYGFQYNELYDMTKRLADISAGAGQDIGRLTLALGHVRSATYLTGITLRQFSMNNIPMLRMLADYYSELEHRAVSTAEVTKRISNKQVSYEDVVEQIYRMTDAGGKFYNMQEKVSTSLKAKFKNLKDSFDIMYGEIAESNIGDVLKGTAALLTTFARQWKSVGMLLGVVAAQFGTARIATLAFSQGINASALNVGLFARSTAKLTAEQIENYLVTGQITKAQLLNAVAIKRITVAQAQLAAATFGVTEAQLQQIASSGKVNTALIGNAMATSKYSVAQLRYLASLRSMNTQYMLNAYGLNGLSKSLLRLKVMALGARQAFSGLVATISSIMPTIAAFAAISVVSDLVLEKSREEEERAQTMSDLMEKSAEGYRNMLEVRKKFAVGASKEMDDESMSMAIDDMVEKLKDYSLTATETFNNAFAIDEEGKSVHSLSEQYEILAKAVDDTTKSYKDLNDMKPLIQEALEQGEDYSGTILDDDFNKVLMKAGDKLFGWFTDMVAGKEFRAATMDFKESLSFYVEAMNQASVAENKFLQSRMDIVAALEKMGYKEVLDMDNEALLTFLTQMQYTAPYAFKKFSWSLKGDAKESLDAMLESWDRLGVASYNAESRMSRMGQNLYNSLKAFYENKDVKDWPDGWKENVLTAANEATRGVQGFADLSKEAQNEILNAFLKPFDITVNTDEAQERVNNLLVELQNLVGRDWVVKIGVKGESSIDDAEAAIKSYKKAVGDIENTQGRLDKLQSDGKRGTEAYTQTMKDQLQAIKNRDAAMEIMKAYGVDIAAIDEELNKKNKGGGTKNTKDELLESAKTQFEELKSFLNEYKKYRDVYGKEKSIDLLEKMFPTTRGKGKQIVENFKVVLSYVKNSLSMDSEARKKFGISIDKYIADFDLDNAKRLIDDALRDVQEYVSRQSERYNLYKTIFEKTGKKGLAMSAFEDGRVWDDVAKEFERKLQEAVGGADIDYNMTDAEAQRLYEGNKEAYELWKKIVEITRKNYTDALTKGAEALAKEYTMEEKILAAEAKIAELREKRNKATDENARKAYDAQIRSEEKNLGKLNWEAFTKGSDYINFFSATLALTNDEVQKTGQTIKQGLANALRDGAITAHDYAKTMKDVNDRMEESAVAWRSNFGAFLQGGQKGVVNRNQSKLQKASEELEQAQEKYNKLRQEGYDEDIANEESLLSVKEEAFKNAAKALGISQENYQQLNKIYNITQIITGALDGLSQIAANLSSMFDALGKQGDADFWGDVADSINGISSAFKPINNLLSNAMSGNVSGIVSSAISAPVEMFTAPITAFAKLHDKQMEREIQASKQREKEMQNLSKNLETALNRSLSSVYGTKASEDMLQKLESKIMSWSYVPDRDNPIRKGGMTTYPVQKVYQRKSYIEEETENAMKNAEKTRSYYDTQYALLLAQRDELQHQMQMEQDKKKTNAQAVEDYKQQLAELQDEIDHFALDMAKALYDIDVKSWADELGDALFEAWQKGEDGAKAFEKKVGDIIGNITKNIITAKIIGEALKPIEDFISSQMQISNGELDPVSFANGLASKLDTAFYRIDSTLFPALDATESAINKFGYTMKEAGSESGLTAGIKGITEETADILASYVNAIRADVSLIRDSQLVHLPIISEACMRGNILAEQQVLEQRQIASNTLRNAEAAEMIYDILHGNVLGANRFAIA